MPLAFRSLRSSSSGNCLMLWTDDTSILIDCGIKTQRECRALLDEHADRLSAVLVSHAHGDHICYSSLKVLEGYGKPIHCHGDVVPHVHRKHVKALCAPPRLMAFSEQSIVIGEFEVQPIPLPHEPHCPTFGFVIRCAGKKIVVCTDFHDPGAVGEHLVDADFIFIEANHDLDLLRRYPNYASHFHLSNRKTAGLLAGACKTSARLPQCVMLGHLSEQRNSEDLARNTIEEQFRKEDLKLNFPVEVAPRYTASKTIHIE